MIRFGFETSDRKQHPATVRDDHKPDSRSQIQRLIHKRLIKQNPPNGNQKPKSNADRHSFLELNENDFVHIDSKPVSDRIYRFQVRAAG